jgi:hypothetical protein
MRLIIIFISYVSSHPTCFGPSLAHHQGCPELLLCYHLVLVVFVGCPCVRGGGLAVLIEKQPRHQYDKTTYTDARTDNKHDKNQMVA